MNPGTQLKLTLLFLIGSIIISVVNVQGNYPPAILKFAVPRVLQNFDHGINKVINKNIIPQHLKASYTYLAMAAYFDRADVALPGFSKYFRKASDRELDNANTLMEYLNKRGAAVWFRDVKFDVMLDENMFSGVEDGLEAFKFALKMEQAMNTKLLNMVDTANNKNDPHLKHTLEDKLLDQKVKVIKEYGDHLANLSNMRDDDYSLAEYEFDKNLA